MKLLITLLFLLGSFSIDASQSIHRFPAAFFLNQSISDGRYNALVNYYNSATGKRAEYTLQVQVQNDRVTAIYFSDGGSIHTGPNNHDYQWTGGYLVYEYDQNGAVEFAFAEVVLEDSKGRRSFEVRIM
jgi:hypothetical protein